MQKVKILGIIAIMLAFLALAPSITSAAGPTVPSGLSYYVPINLTNSQSTATPAPFQQMINLTESNAIYGSYIAYSGSLANFEYFYSNGTIIPAWIESNSSGKLITWANTIGIGASSKLTIYLGFASKTTNLLSSSGTTGIGEAPQIPCGTTATSSCSTYAQYDDGASVFSFYDNFAGTTLSSKWTTSAAAAAPTTSVNNGLTLTPTGAGQFQGYYNTYSLATGYTVDAYMSTTYTGTAGYCSAFGQYTGITAEVGTSSSTVDYRVTTTSSGDPTANGNSGGSVTSGQMYLVSLNINSGSQAIQSEYVQQATATYTTSASNLAIYTYGPSSLTSFYQYVRARLTPPNGVMPSVSFGTVQRVLTLSISPNPSTYGQSITITATCTLSTDSCAIDYPSLGTAIATGTGSATYTYNAFSLGAGTYSSFYANDITAGTNSIAQTLTVNKVPSVQACTYRGNAVANGITYTELWASGLVNCTVTSHNNQLSGTLAYNSVNVASGASISYNAIWDDFNNTLTWSNAGNPNYTSNTMTWHLNYIPYLFISSSLGATGYETSTQNPIFTFNLTKYDGKATVTLNVNGKNVSTDTQNISNTQQTFILGYPIPLLPTNGVVYDYNAILTLSNPFNEVVNPANTLTQTELWNYLPSVTALPNPAILGNNMTFNTSIAQVNSYNAVNVTGDVKLGNQTLTEQVLGEYNYKAIALSFVPKAFNLTMPTLGTSQTYTLNSILKLSFMGANVFRNTSTTFTDYYPAITNCTSPYTTNTLTWTFYNASTLAEWPANVLVQTFFNPIENGYTGPTISGTAGATFTNPATSNSYISCIYPSFAHFGISATLTYSSALTHTPAQSSIYINYPISNVIQPQKLYILPNSTPLQYEIFIQNTSSDAFIAGLVKIGLYNPNTNTTIPVGTILVPAGLGTLVTLQGGGDKYVFQAYTTDGQTLLATTPPFEPVAGSSSVQDYVIPVGKFVVRLPNYYLNQIITNCTAGTIVANSVNVNCNFNVKTGGSYPFTISAVKTIAQYANTTCTDTLTGSFGTVSCPFANIYNNSYTWQFTTQINGTTYLLQYGTIGQQPLAYGLDGVWIALLAIIVLVTAMISRNANLGIIMFDIGFIGMSVIGFINLPLKSATLGGLIIVSGLLLYMINRQRQ